MSSIALLAFAVTLVAAVLISELASRSLLSTTVLFLGAGFLLGAGVNGLQPLTADDELVQRFAELSLVAVLFTDGMRITTDALRGNWRLPGRALFIGMPLTFVVTAWLAHVVAGVPWLDAWLVGAALAPTDPVFAAALVGHKAVPGRVQHLLNVESGVNDGLALPIVMVLLATAGGRGESAGAAVIESIAGAALGWLLAWAVVKLESLRFFGASPKYTPIVGLAVGILVFAVAGVTRANEFLAAFVAGVTVTAYAPQMAHAFEATGDVLAEVLKLAAVMVFGALLFNELHGVSLREWLFALMALFIARPVALTPSLAMTALDWRERLTVAWFGPKGFASVFFGVLILGSGMADADRLFRLVALVVALSIVAHSSTDVAIAGWLDRTSRRAQ